MKENWTMTPEEMYKSYKEAKDQKEQIKILADLNCTKTARIIEILNEQGAGITITRYRTTKALKQEENPEATVDQPQSTKATQIEVQEYLKRRQVKDLEPEEVLEERLVDTLRQLIEITEKKLSLYKEMRDLLTKSS